MIRLPRLRRPVSRPRFALLLALTGAATVVASLQFTPVALFDSALTDELAGVAAGMALMVVVVWVINRLRHG